MVYSGKLRDDLNDRLFEAILSLKDVDECYRFFEDISTVSELRSLAQRLEVAKMLELTEPTEISPARPEPVPLLSAG
ncbi:hypothetical protein N752_07480 [Desulforamulus aquiferis]|nr:hypothetical protein N752_07480 [Desulforamulus aquiferis]